MLIRVKNPMGMETVEKYGVGRVSELPYSDSRGQQESPFFLNSLEDTLANHVLMLTRLQAF
jgi:hypothetical protein